MKKVNKFLLALVLMFFVFGTGTAEANQDLLSEMVKKDANLYCGSATFSVIQEETFQDDVIQDEMLQDEKFEIDTDMTKSSSLFVDKTATSKSGSKIIMPAVSAAKYGYCHLYKDHMKRSNGKLSNVIGTKTQFKYAYYPDKTMKIALEVINLQNTLIDQGNGRYRKEVYSPLAGQKVRVVFNSTSDFAGGKYSKYKFVIVTMYPI